MYGLQGELSSGLPVDFEQADQGAVAWYGPTMMNTDGDLDLAFEEYRNGIFIKHKLNASRVGVYGTVWMMRKRGEGDHGIQGNNTRFAYRQSVQTHRKGLDAHNSGNAGVIQYHDGELGRAGGLVGAEDRFLLHPTHAVYVRVH